MNKIETMKKLGFLLVTVILVFTGVQAQNKIIYINHEMANCIGVVPGKCLQYRYKTSQPWLLLHGQIQGFNYEAGNMYKLKIRETKVKNPPADGSSIKRTLVKVLSKEPMMSIALPHESISEKWVIGSIFKSGQKQDVSTKNFLLHFNEETQSVSGKVCNSFRGSLSTQKGNRITIGQLMSTKMLCSDIDFENSIMASLQSANSYGFNGDTLLLSQDGNVLLALTLQQQADAAQTDSPKKSDPQEKIDISNKTWYFTSYNFEDNLVDISPLGSFILFNKQEQKVTGHAPCNNFFGTAIFESISNTNGKLKLDKIGSTMMACENLSAEQIVMKLLAMVDEYEISETSLVLKMADKPLFHLTTQKPAEKNSK
jgi:heat shock protein HslJ